MATVLFVELPLNGRVSEMGRRFPSVSKRDRFDTEAIGSTLSVEETALYAPQWRRKSPR
jgi:hypothetical protein